MVNEFEVRTAVSTDMSAIYALMTANDMVGEIEASECVVAYDGIKLLGFARIEMANDIPYLRPVVVAKAQQGKGVGRQLVQFLLDKRPNLHVVGRGDAANFYKCLGFVPASWDNIYPAFIEECRLCPDLASCQPIPFIRPGQG